MKAKRVVDMSSKLVVVPAVIHDGGAVVVIKSEIGPDTKLSGSTVRDCL